jgi:isoleucyl-tRNA synthetase
MNNFSEIEKNIISFWDQNKIFDKTIKNREKSPFYSFYDGPPFATGTPHYGHILATTIKDSVLRYWTMKGYYVPRRVGWDCHGLPVENLIEKELNIKSKKEIESMGMEKFNNACKSAVFRRVEDFEYVLKRVGRWADYSNSYATLDNDYIESVWWVFSNLWNQGLVYQDHRVTPYCPRCETPISNFEVNQGYKEVKEDSIYLKFKIKDEKFKDCYFLVWTTTPWTVPGNVALAVNTEIEYVLISTEKEKLILAENRLSLIKEDYEVIEKLKGKNLLNIKYEPPFSFLEKVDKSDNAFKVLPGPFVVDSDGTGIVHIAPMYGEDDFSLGKDFDLPMIHTVDKSGNFTEVADIFSGVFVKKAEEDIIKVLIDKNLFYKKESYTHSYPFCWRCDTSLLYYALDTWYLDVSSIKTNLIENNKKIRWVPDHIKEGRFGKWLEGAKDWAFSRNRFWGAPIPIWKCDTCGETKCISSVNELPKKLEDLHRPYIDEIKFKCDCGGQMNRIEEVFDCWFESGAMPYAQWHYPFENKELVEKTFPADFIAEGLDQTRGWFYTLHVLATALTVKDIGLKKDNPAFKNVIVNGLILDSEGQKLSKKLKNYPETSEIFDRYGADSLRYFLLSSTTIGEDYLFSSKGVEDVYRKIISTFYNSYIFFKIHKEEDFVFNENFRTTDPLNRWIISKTNSLNKEVSEYMEKYELTKATRLFEDFIDNLSNWYIRRSRRKLQKPESFEEKDEASQTLYFALINLSKMIAPFTPFISEHIYLDLIKLRKDRIEESVHLSDYPEPDLKMIDKDLEDSMVNVREIVALALSERSKAGIKVRQPLSVLEVKEFKNKKSQSLIGLIKDEVNVKDVKVEPSIDSSVRLDINITDELKEEGFIRETIRTVQETRKSSKLTKKDKIKIVVFGSKKIEDIILKWKEMIISETLAVDIDFNKKDSVDEKEISFESEKAKIQVYKTE